MAKLIGLNILPKLKDRISNKFLGKDSMKPISSDTIKGIIDDIEKKINN